MNLKHKNQIKISFFLMIVFVFAISMSIGALATVYAANGNTLTDTVSGYTYNSWNTIYVDTNYGAAAATTIGSTSTIPSGYMGVHPLLLDGDENYIAWGTAIYNTTPKSSLTNNTVYYDTRGNYCSHGVSFMWNTSSSSYSTGIPGKTPTLTY